MQTNQGLCERQRLVTVTSTEKWWREVLVIRKTGQGRACSEMSTKSNVSSNVSNVSDVSKMK